MEKYNVEWMEKKAIKYDVQLSRVVSLSNIYICALSLNLMLIDMSFSHHKLSKKCYKDCGF